MGDKKDDTTPKDTKAQKAKAIVKENNAKMTTKELVSKVMTECKMSALGARTYVYNARKELNLDSPPRQKAAKKATTSKKKPDQKTPKKRESKKAADKKAPASAEAETNKSEAAAAIND